MMDDIHRQLGKQGAEINALQEDMTEVKGDVKKALSILDQAQGGWKIMVVIGGIAGAIGAFAGKLLFAIGSMVK